MAGCTRNAYFVCKATRRGEPWTTVPKPDKLPEPANLDRLKDQVGRRWGTIDLLDFLKEADFLTDLTGVFTSVATREVVPRDIVRRRLLYVLFALGTNMGIKALADGLASSGEQADTEAALRRAPLDLRQPRQPAPGHRPGRQRHLRRPGHRTVGRGHGVCLGLQEVGQRQNAIEQPVRCCSEVASPALARSSPTAPSGPAGVGGWGWRHRPALGLGHGRSPELFELGH
jgi:hypothetical protein